MVCRIPPETSSESALWAANSSRVMLPRISSQPTDILSRILMRALRSTLDVEECSFEAPWTRHRSQLFAEFSPQHRSCSRQGASDTLRRHGTLGALFKTHVKNGDFHGTLRALELPFIGILRAFQRDFTCALLVYSCSPGRKPVVGLPTV